MTKKIQDIIDCVEYQLELRKKEYVKKYGTKEAHGFMKRDAFKLQGIINTLAWVKVFAIGDKNYNPKKLDK